MMFKITAKYQLKEGCLETAIFSDGFESDDFSAWNGTTADVSVKIAYME